MFLPFIGTYIPICIEYTNIKDVDQFLCIIDVATVIWLMILMTYPLYFIYMETKHHYVSYHDRKSI